MKMRSLDKIKYQEIKELIEELKKMRCWTQFESDNVFLFKDGKKESVFTFIRNYGNDVKGISCFFDNEGMNTLHDMYTIDNLESLTPFNYNITNLMLIDKKDLSETEKVFLKKMKEPLRAKDNILLKTYKTGYAPFWTTGKEALRIIKYLSYLVSILAKDKKRIVNGFKEDLACQVNIFDSDDSYSLLLSPLPYLERDYKVVKAKQQELEEFDGIESKDYSIEFAFKGIEVPLMHESSNFIYPVFVILASTDYGINECESLCSEPKDYREQIINIFKNYFEKFGKPKSICFNNRMVYYLLVDLLERLEIECSLQIVNEGFDIFLEKINNVIKAYFSIAYKNELIYDVKMDELQTLFDFIKKIFKNEEPTFDLSDIETEILNLFENGAEDEQVEINEEDDTLVS